jgi:hypothetical protein
MTKAIKNVLATKTLEDLQPEKPNALVSHEIEMTAEHVELIVQLHKQGVSRREIKRQVKHSGDDRLGLSWKQIDEVLAAINTRIAELTPVEEIEELEK